MPDKGFAPIPIRGDHIQRYLEEILYAAETIDEIRPRFERLVREPHTGPNTTALFATLNQILVAASAVHYVFTAEKETSFREVDPSRQAQVADFSRRRAAIIRAALGEPPAALEARDVRNGLEHFSARLDAFLTDIPGISADRIISFSGELEGITWGDGTPITPVYVRHFRKNDFVLELLGHTIDMNEVVKAVRDVALRAFEFKKCLDTCSWEDVLSDLGLPNT